MGLVHVVVAVWAVEGAGAGGAREADAEGDGAGLEKGDIAAAAGV